MDGNSGYGQYDYDYGGAEGGMYMAKDFRMSKSTYLFLALFQQMLAGGVIFGWQALLPVLYDYGVFAESCKGSTEAYPCLKMRSKLALVFSIAGSANAVGGMVAGLIMDRLGPRVARMFSSFIVLLGSFMLAYAGPESLLWFPGLACLGFGGNGIQITSFHISNLFPGNEKLVVSLIAGAFAASASLFTIMRSMHDSLDWDMRTLFLAYSGVSGAVFLTSSVWPDKPFTSPDDLEKPDEEEYVVKQARSVDQSCHSLPSDSDMGSREGSMHGSFRARNPFGRLGSNSGDEDLFTPLMGELEIIEEHGPTVVATDNHLCLDLSTMPLWQQLRTPEWIGFLIFFNIQLLASTYFMTAVGDQLSCVVCGCGGRCFDPTCMQACTPENHQRGDQWLMAFGVIYPLGFITTPLCGYLQDRYQLSIVLIFVNFTFLAWEAIALVPDINVQAIGLVCFSSSRQFLFSFFFAAVGSTFGYENFGFLTGLANAVSAGVLMLNAPLYEITASHFDVLYIVFMVFTMLFFAYAVLLKRRFMKLRQVCDEASWDISHHESSQPPVMSKQ